MPSLYSVPIENLKGIGKKRAEMFNRLGVYSVGDLLEFYPSRYENWSQITDISQAPINENVCIKATVGSFINTVRTKGGRILSKFSAFDHSAGVEIVFFNNRYINSMISYGDTLLFYGKITRSVSGLQMLSPQFQKCDAVSDSAGYKPIYRLTGGLQNRIVSNAVKTALEMLPQNIRDPLPQALREKFSLCDYKTAIEQVHFPQNGAQLEQARRRLICQELFILMQGMLKLKKAGKSSTEYKLCKVYTDEFSSLLQFDLTKDQLNAIHDCINDMANGENAMSRLVQGDVGSGKTAVAAAVCYSAVKNGWQCAFMAPTEILARQHYESLSRLFENSGINVDLLTGAVSESQKKIVRQKTASGETDIAVGTHALITDKTRFNNLGLVITDEQHRFGVSQRAKLVSKGDNPHLLVMSATPIPRTLGLIIYGDLDISVIDTLPPGRHKIDTFLINKSMHSRACNFIKEQIKSGRQAYIVCPLVEENDTDVASADEYAAELMLKEFSDIPVGILHGKMKSAEKEKVITQFEKGEISVLVSTTVVEVGVNVPNATVMMIENAERFGLSQLHQLRGRVGRGSEKSYCILVSESKNPDTLDRLETLCKTNDGFKIADADLHQRGPGDFFGERQHGLPKLAIADFADRENLETAKKMGEYFEENKNDFSASEISTLNACTKRLFNREGYNILN